MAIITVTRASGKKEKYETNRKKRAAQEKAKSRSRSSGSSNKIVITRASGQIEEKEIGAKGGYTITKPATETKTQSRTTVAKAAFTPTPSGGSTTTRIVSTTSPTPSVQRVPFETVSGRIANQQLEAASQNRLALTGGDLKDKPFIQVGNRVYSQPKEEPKEIDITGFKNSFKPKTRSGLVVDTYKEDERPITQQIIEGAGKYIGRTAVTVGKFVGKATTPYMIYSLNKKTYETLSNSKDKSSSEITKELLISNPFEVGKESLVGQAIGAGGVLLAVPFGTIGTAAQAGALTTLGAYQLTIGAPKVAEGYSSEDYELAGEGIVDLAGGVFSVVGATTKTAQVISDISIQIGGEYIPPDELIASTQYPRTSSTAETARRFADSDDILIHSSQQELKGSSPVAGQKGLLGYEDAGLYGTTAETGASTAFLGVDDAGSYSFSLKPTAVRKPTISLFKTKGLSDVPEEVLQTQGFKATSSYAEQNIAPEGQAYITKRSMIGQGEIQRQQWTVEEDIVSPFSGKTIPKGTKLWEAGTSEEELVLPLTSKFIKSSDVIGSKKYYTKINGRPVQVKGYETVKFSDVQTGQVSPSAVSEAQKEFAIGSSAYSDLVGSRRLSIVPVSIPSTSSSTTSSEFSTSWKSPKEVFSEIKLSTTSSETSSSSRKPFAPYKPSLPTYKPEVIPIVSIPTSSKRKGGSSPLPPPPPYVPDPYVPPPPPYVPDPYIPPPYTPTPPTGGSSSGILTKSYYEQPIVSFTKRSQRRRPTTKRFELLVRKKGSFKSFGKFESEGLALSRGRTVVGTSAAATFKIRDVKGDKYLRAFSLGSTFRVGKKSPFEFVEKRGKRIKSSGELREITFKGIAAPKKKKKRFII